MRRLLALIAALAVFGLVDSASGQGPAFYDGKTLRIIVGLAAGGGFDTYARLLWADTSAVTSRANRR